MEHPSVTEMPKSWGNAGGNWTENSASTNNNRTSRTITPNKKLR